MEPASRLSLLLLLAVSAPAGVAAQTQAQRTLIEAFRDSLDQAPDSTGLVRLDTRIVRDVQRARPDPFEHLRLGFLALRLGDLGRSRGYEDAAMEFQTVTRLAPRWGFGWYGLGLAEYAVGRAAVGQAGGEVVPPTRAYARAVTALARSASTDASFIPALVEEAYNGRRQRDPSRSTVAVAALRLAGEGRSPTAALLLGRGRVEREFGDPEHALEAFEALLRVSRSSRGLNLLEIARTRFLLGRTDGATPYYEGAASDETASVEAYRMDLAAIASDDELTRFDATRGGDRVTFLRRFWGYRDAAEFRDEGERLLEHYRRLYFARRTFPGYVPTRWRELTRRVAVTDEVDDRGLVHIRHGEPDNRVSLTSVGFEPNESWHYDRAEGDLVLHFVARHAPDDFHLVESLFDVVEARNARGGAASGARGDGAQQLLRSREPLSPFYRTGGAPDRTHTFRVAERALSRASMITATTSDSHRRRYPRSLDARADLVLLGDGPSVFAQVAIAVPFSATGSAWLGGGLTFPLRLRVVGLDAAGMTVTAMDTMLRAQAVTYHEARWLAGTLSVPVPEGRLRIRLAVEDDDAGTVLPFRALEVKGAGVPLAISDLAVAEIDAPWRMSLASGSLFLDPVGVIDRDRPVELAFEARARPGTTLSCQVTLIRTDDQPGVALSDTWREAIGRGVTLVRYRLGSRRLAPGFYRAEITVTDGQGQLVRRWREFRVAP
ncbi:MAG TPA: GWxTD domain-containing protein [Gemmatimonadales bacterium]